MGRTQRHRRRRSKLNDSFSLDSDPKIISLKRWLRSFGWKDESKLRLAYFPIGRGLSSSIDIEPDDKIISLPFKALISFANFENGELWDVVSYHPKKLKSMDLFAMFFTIERHKRSKSVWKEYMATLPETPVMPWLCSKDEFQYLPSDVREDMEEVRLCLESSLVRLRYVLKESNSLVCSCCESLLVNIITKECYISNYILVLTRSVHLDPSLVLPYTYRNILEYILDTPHLVMCPLLDMFNHSSDHDAETNFDTKQEMFSIVTRCRFKKNQQLFFAYGKHHNLDLLRYYGFYIPINELDFIVFQLDFILKHWSLPKEKYNFIIKKDLSKKLKVYLSGASFNLKAVLYIILTDTNDWPIKIYTDSYSNLELFEINQNLIVLLKETLKTFNTNLTNMMKCKNPTKSFDLILRYYADRVKFAEAVINRLRNANN